MTKRSEPKAKPETAEKTPAEKTPAEKTPAAKTAVLTIADAVAKVATAGVDPDAGLTEAQTAVLTASVAALHPSARKGAASDAVTASMAAGVDPKVIGLFASAVQSAVDASRSTGKRASGPTPEDRRDGLTAGLAKLAAAMVALAGVDGLTDDDREAVFAARPDLFTVAVHAAAANAADPVTVDPAKLPRLFRSVAGRTRTTVTGRSLKNVPAGTVVNYNGKTAKVAAAGLTIGGKLHANPTAAAKAANGGKSVNGWIVWTTKDGATLDAMARK